MIAARKKRKAALYKSGSASAGERKLFARANGATDSPDNQIIELAKRGKLDGAARRAIRRQTAKGLPVTFRKGSLVVKRFADGREEIVAKLSQTPYSLPPGVKIIRKK